MVELKKSAVIERTERTLSKPLLINQNPQEKPNVSFLILEFTVT